MARSLLIAVFLALGVLIASISYVARSAYGPEDPDLAQTREQAPPMRRLGYHDMLPHGDPQTWTGVLMDAGCPTRESFSPAAVSQQPATPQAPEAAAPPAAAGNAPQVEAQAAQQGKQPAAQAHTHGENGAPNGHDHAAAAPDVRGRQLDMSCAVTGFTRGFAVWLPNGQVKRLDEGGNTRALAAFQATPDGQAVLSGQAPGANPRAEITGRVQGDRIVVQTVRIL